MAAQGAAGAATPGADGAKAEPPAEHPTRLLNADDLRRLPPPANTPADCACAHLRCAGWESVTGPLGPPLLRAIGTLRDAADEDPTLQEAPGAGYWSAEAAISPAHFPYNRCGVWACAACGRGFLQYTEYGGYYVDHRLREVNPARVMAGHSRG